jgi:hypothetical protein
MDGCERIEAIRTADLQSALYATATVRIAAPRHANTDAILEVATGKRHR